MKAIEVVPTKPSISNIFSFVKTSTSTVPSTTKPNEVTTLDSFEVESDDFASNFFNEIESESDKKDKKPLSLDFSTIQRKSTETASTTEDPFLSFSFSSEDFGFSSSTAKIDEESTTASSSFISFTKPKSSTSSPSTTESYFNSYTKPKSTKTSTTTTEASTTSTQTSNIFGFSTSSNFLELSTSSLEDFSSIEIESSTTFPLYSTTEEPTTFSTSTTTTTTTERPTTKINCKLGSLDLRCPPTCNADSKDVRCPKPMTSRIVPSTTPSIKSTSQYPTTIDDYISKNYNQLQVLLEAQKSEILKSTTKNISRVPITTITEEFQSTTPVSLTTLVKANTKLFELASTMKATTTSTTTEPTTTEFVSLELTSSEIDTPKRPSTTTKKAPFSDAEDLAFLRQLSSFINVGNRRQNSMLPAARSVQTTTRRPITTTSTTTPAPTTTHSTSRRPTTFSDTEDIQFLNSLVSKIKCSKFG